MLFYGDIALPEEEYIPDGLLNISTEIGVANLEGPIIKEGNIKERKLFNDVSVLDLLSKLNIKVVSLANNHIMDMGNDISYTIKKLEENGILWCGYGENIEKAGRPALLEENGIVYAFLGFGWNVAGCKYATKNKQGVNPLTKQNVHLCIKRVRVKYPNAKIIVMLHWGVELEKYPEPLHRKLASCMIESGAELVIGHHPHCLQGFEFYSGKLIVYSLGNCLIPDKIYWNHNLSYPEYAKLQMAVKWNGIEKTEFLYYSYETEEHNFVKFKGEINLLQYESFSEKESEMYVNWFKKNRYKRKGVPIFKDDCSKI